MISIKFESKVEKGEIISGDYGSIFRSVRFLVIKAIFVKFCFPKLLIIEIRSATT